MVANKHSPRWGGIEKLWCFLLNRTIRNTRTQLPALCTWAGLQNICSLALRTNALPWQFTMLLWWRRPVPIQRDHFTFTSLFISHYLPHTQTHKPISRIKPKTILLVSFKWAAKNHLQTYLHAHTHIEMQSLRGKKYFIPLSKTLLTEQMYQRN